MQAAPLAVAAQAHGAGLTDHDGIAPGTHLDAGGQVAVVVGDAARRRARGPLIGAARLHGVLDVQYGASAGRLGQLADPEARQDQAPAGAVPPVDPGDGPVVDAAGGGAAQGRRAGADGVGGGVGRGEGLARPPTQEMEPVLGQDQHAVAEAYGAPYCQLLPVDGGGHGGEAGAVAEIEGAADDGEEATARGRAEDGRHLLGDAVGAGQGGHW